MASPEGRAVTRQRASVYAFAAFFVALALVALTVGLHDATISRASLGVTVGSVLLLAVGVVMLLAAYQLVRLNRPSAWEDGVRDPCAPLVLIAFLLAILVGANLFVSSIGAVSAQRPVVVAIALLLVATALAGLRFFGKDARVTLPRLGAIALGLIGTIVGVSEFWYQNQYVPSHAGSAVALKAELERTPGPRYDVIRATVSEEDIGGRTVSVLGSTYTLTGSRVVRCRRPAAPDTVRKLFDKFVTDPQRSRFMGDVWEVQPATVLAAGKFVGDGKHLDPNVPAGRTLVFFVPRGRYQLLRLRTQLFAVPASVRLSQRTLPEYSLGGDKQLYGLWHVDDDSWLHDLVSGRERWVVIRYELVNSPRARLTSPDFRVTARFPDPTWSKDPPSAARMEGLFVGPQPSDASEPFADSELALEPVAEPGPRDKLPPSCK